VRSTKLCAFREKDRNFVDALIAGHLVDPTVIADRLNAVPAQYNSNIKRAAAWLALRSKPADRTYSRLLTSGHRLIVRLPSAALLVQGLKS
jgi:hypothetical protein